MKFYIYKQYDKFRISLTTKIFHDGSFEHLENLW